MWLKTFALSYLQISIIIFSIKVVSVIHIKKKNRYSEKNCCKGKSFDTLHEILLLFLSHIVKS